MKTSINTNMERHFAMNRCYLPGCLRCRTPICQYALRMETALEREALAQRGKHLEYFTIAWNSLEGLVAVMAGALAGSISLVGFGIDSFIEVTSGTVLLWRMAVDADVRRRERNEQLSLRIVGVCFLTLAAYVGYESISNLVSSAPCGRFPTFRCIRLKALLDTELQAHFLHFRTCQF